MATIVQPTTIPTRALTEIAMPLLPPLPLTADGPDKAADRCVFTPGVGADKICGGTDAVVVAVVARVNDVSTAAVPAADVVLVGEAGAVPMVFITGMPRADGGQPTGCRLQGSILQQPL